MRQPRAMPATMAIADAASILLGGEIVEEEQRLGALGDDVVDVHRNEVDADRVEDAGLDRDLELGADPVGGADQDGIVEAGPGQVEQTAEAADLGVGARAARGPHDRFQRLDEVVAGVDVDARVGIAQRRALPRTSTAHGFLPPLAARA